ncbi:MAG: PAS domain S-box protein [Ignavibacteriaceae bacterium]
MNNEKSNEKNEIAETTFSETDFINFFNLSSDLLIITDFNGTLQKANPSFINAVGLDEKHINSFSLSDFFHNEDEVASKLIQIFQQSNWNNNTFEARLKCFKDDYQWTEWSISPSKNFQCFYAIGRNISKRKKDEEFLRQSEQKHRTLFETMAQGVIYEDFEKGIISANPAAQKILGLSLEQMQGKSSLGTGYKSILEDGTEVIDDTHSAMLAVKIGKELKNFVMGILTPYEEDYRWININAIPLFKLGEEKPYQVYTTFDDITERKRSSEAIKESEERYRKLIELSPNTVGILKDEKIVFINAAGAKMMGAENPKKIIGKNILEFLHPDYFKYISKGLKQLSRYNKSPLMEIKARKIDGTTIYVEATAMPFNYKGENAVQFISRDITERKKVEEEKERLFHKITVTQDRLKILSRRLIEAQESERRIIAHELHDEIGQTLTAIKINLQAVDKLTTSKKLKSHLVDSVELVEHSLELVRNLSLDLRPSMLDDLGLVPALRWYLHKQMQRSGIKIKINSVEFRNELSSEIEVTCYRVTQEAINNVIRHSNAKNVKVELNIFDNHLRLFIQDDGDGFNVSDARKKALNGNSIGVLGMQERAELVGGELAIYSSSKKGTKIIASFPII